MHLCDLAHWNSEMRQLVAIWASCSRSAADNQWRRSIVEAKEEEEETAYVQEVTEATLKEKERKGTINIESRRGRGIEQLPAWLAWGVPLLHKPTT
jgi:hypothetical protein